LIIVFGGGDGYINDFNKISNLYLLLKCNSKNKINKNILQKIILIRETEFG
jgi:hypothetical protein